MRYPETPAPARDTPDYNQVLLTSFHWSGEYESFRLPPGGWLIAITIQPGIDMPKPEPDALYRAEYEVTDEDALYGTIRWQLPLSSCGIMFPQPIVNMNSRSPYLIKRLSPKVSPAVKISVLHALQYFP